MSDPRSVAATANTEASESGYGQLLRLVASTIDASDPHAAASLRRAAEDIEAFIRADRDRATRLEAAETALREIARESEAFIQDGLMPRMTAIRIRDRALAIVPEALAAGRGEAFIGSAGATFTPNAAGRGGATEVAREESG